MRFSDYTRLGKISIKSRKKSTKNTVRGISFGLIMIVSVLFLAFAVFMSFNTEINKIKTIATFTLQSKNYNSTSAGEAAVVSNGYMQSPGIPSYATMQRIKQNPACEESLVSNLFYFQNYGQSAFTYEIKDGANGAISSGSNSGSYNSIDPSMGIRVINLSESNGKTVLDAELHDLGSNPVFIAGTGFSMDSSGKTGGKGEVILTYNAAESIAGTQSVSSLIGKKLTVGASGQVYGIYIDDDFDPNNSFTAPQNSSQIFTVKLMQEFTIKAIVSQELCSLPSRTGSEVMFWVSEQSLEYTQNDTLKSLLPVIKLYESDIEYSREYVVTYPMSVNDAQIFAKDNSLIFPFYGAVEYNTMYYYNNSAPELHAINMLQGESFSKAVTLSAIINNEISSLFSGIEASEISGVYQNMMYSLLNMLFTALQVVTLILFIFGGVLFVTSMLNLYNSINYSVQARRNYLGMMRAIGAKDASIPKMYFVEMVLIFMRTLVWVLIFSFGICFGLRALVGKLVEQAGDMLMGMNLSLNLIYYPISLGAIYAVVFLIAVFFALTSCKSVSKKPILDVLRTDI